MEAVHRSKDGKIDPVLDGQTYARAASSNCPMRRGENNWAMSARAVQGKRRAWLSLPGRQSGRDDPP